jgi:hypothetical protein
MVRVKNKPYMLSIVMLRVFMLSVFMLSVFMLIVVMQSVVTPPQTVLRKSCDQLLKNKKTLYFVFNVL